jgi:hypothetical protein
VSANQFISHFQAYVRQKRRHALHPTRTAPMNANWCATGTTLKLTSCAGTKTKYPRRSVGMNAYHDRSAVLSRKSTKQHTVSIRALICSGLFPSSAASVTKNPAADTAF